MILKRRARAYQWNNIAFIFILKHNTKISFLLFHLILFPHIYHNGAHTGLLSFHFNLLVRVRINKIINNHTT